MKTILLALFSVLVLDTASGQVGTYTRVLLPVLPTMAPTPGAYGSAWVTSAHVAHNAQVPVRIYPFGVCASILCDLTPPPIPPELSVDLQVGDDRYRGYFMFVESEHADRVAFTLRTQDVSRAALNFGTAIPTPSEDAFTAKTFSIGQVPTDSRFRSRLRLYSLENEPTDVTVRLYEARNAPSGLLFMTDVPPDVLVRADTVTLAPQPPRQGFGIPAVAEIPLDLSGIPGEFVRIEIEPKDQRSRLWAFVSVMNNEAQHLTVLQP